MSMNLILIAKRKITIDKTGKKDWRYNYFDLWHTPTNDTYAIFVDRDFDATLSNYLKWLDQFEDRDPVSFGPAVKKHKGRLDKFIADCKEGGYTLEFYVM